MKPILDMCCGSRMFYFDKTNSNGVITHYSPEIYDALRLTGKEIKAIDERYWPFAVPVDEVTE